MRSNLDLGLDLNKNLLRIYFELQENRKIRLLRESTLDWYENLFKIVTRVFFSFVREATLDWYYNLLKIATRFLLRIA